MAAAGSTAMVQAGTAVGTAAAGWANAAGTAVAMGMASNGAISTINNRGNLGDVVKDVTSSDALRGYVVAGTTAGLTAGVYDKWTSTQTGTSTALPNTGAVAPAAGLGTWQGVGQFTSNQLLQNGTSVLLDRALGGKGSLGDALQNSLANAFAAYGFKLIGDTTHGVLDDGSLGKIGLHALMGGLAAEAVGGDFRTGALAAGVNEALVDSLAKQYASLPIDDKKGLLIMSSQLIGVLAASTQGDADAKSLQTGAWVAGNATQHNYLSHWQEEKKRQEVDGCKDKQLCKTGIEAKWAIISAQQDVGIVVGVGGGIGLSTAETAVGVYELVKNWRETYAALEQLATSPEFRQQFGDNYLKGLEERAAFLTQAYEDAGWQGSVTAGVEGGRFAAELVGVLTAVKGGAQITAKLPTAAKNLVNAIAESPVSGSMSSQLGAVGDLGRLGGGGKGYVDILSHEAKQHILYGDKPGSGGHLWPGQAGKTVFPQNWSADKIVHEVGDIATSPSTKWYAQTGTGGVYTSKGDPAKWVAYEVRDGVRMRVVYQPATGKVITAFPDNAPIPPYKPIK